MDFTIFTHFSQRRFHKKTYNTLYDDNSYKN